MMKFPAIPPCLPLIVAAGLWAGCAATGEPSNGSVLKGGPPRDPPSGVDLTHVIDTQAKRLLKWLRRWLRAATGEPSNGSVLKGGPPRIPPPSGVDLTHVIDTQAKPDPAAMERRIQAIAHFSAGVSLEARQKGKEALDEFYQAGMSDPADEELVLQVSRRLLAQRDSGRAVTMLLKATEKLPLSATLDSWLSIAYAQAGKLDFAIRAANTSITKSPVSIQAYKNLCAIYGDMDRQKECSAVLHRAAAQKGAGVEFLTELAAMHHIYALRWPADAKSVVPRIRDLLAKARSLKSKDPLHLRALAETCRLTGDYPQAAAVFEELLVLVPDDPALQEQAVELFLVADKLALAEKWINTLLADDEDNPQAHRLMALLCIEQRNHAKASESFAKVLELNPAFEPGYYELAESLLAQKKQKEALQVIERARRRFKPSFLQDYMACTVQMQVKDYPAALKHIQAAERFAQSAGPEYLTAGFYFQLGAVQERNKLFKEAEATFRKVIGMKSDFAPALNYLGYMFAERGENLKEGKELIQKALTAEPNSTAYLDSMAWVTFQLGDAKAALVWQLKALKGMEADKEPDAVLYEHLGDIYHALKDDAKAREFWTKSLAVEANPKVQDRLKQLPAQKP